MDPLALIEGNRSVNSSVMRAAFPYSLTVLKEGKGRLPRDPFGMRPASFVRRPRYVLTFFGDLVVLS